MKIQDGNDWRTKKEHVNQDLDPCPGTCLLTSPGFPLSLIFFWIFLMNPCAGTVVDKVLDGVVSSLAARMDMVIGYLTCSMSSVMCQWTF